ncbi:diguanylate cyclase, partial [Erysipelatoclostridium ramosum]|nr:diguanylate cyclase [Thomasclavelia ramosa]
MAATLVLLNIDHFQRINHRYGMQQGDAVLRLVYKVLHQHLGSGEFLARGEGDSFFLFLRTRDEKQLQNRIDEMQKT